MLSAARKPIESFLEKLAMQRTEPLFRRTFFLKLQTP
jgi:hypothetical protein